MEDLSKIPKLLKQLRLAHGYKSYEIFAFDHDISRTSYWRWENGNGNMNLESLQRILNVYNMSLSTFFLELEKVSKKE